MRFTLLLLSFALSVSCFAQYSFTAIVKDSASLEVISGATAALKGTQNGTASDERGLVSLHNIPAGTQTIVFNFIGFDEKERQIVFPLSSSEAQIILLSPKGKHLEEIIVEGTRSNRSIANIPTRVEVLTEEIDEASTMDPSKVAHLLTHSTGIQVQQTSATSNTANVRIQGLDGRYTQILKDGFPLYGGFSGSLSIMQIPPLDLRQVEYIKGSASTLYGGGAIAGLINLISKEPNKEETLLHLNASQIGALDVNAYMSRKINKLGITLLAQRNVHRAFDADNDGYSDMPKLAKYNLNPQLFFYLSDKTKLSVGGTLTSEVREGGDMDLVGGRPADSQHFYKEQNDVSRVTTQLKLSYQVNDELNITVRNSLNMFHRELSVTPSPALNQYHFAGRQLSSFSELTLSHRRKQNVLITGLNFYTDDFKEEKRQSAILRNEGYQTIGAFANYTFDVGKLLSVEGGLRTDYVFDEKLFVLPRIAFLFKWTSKLTTRISGGMGYKNPTIFSQDAEILGYDKVMAIDRSAVKPEESYGGGADLGFKTPLGNKFSISINQMFFFTYLDRPLVLVNSMTLPGYRNFINAPGHTKSYGGETFFKFGFYDFVLFVGYTYTNATNEFNNVETPVTLTPSHSLKGDLLYSIPGKWRIGVDYEFKSSQTLSNGNTTPSYWTYGALVEYTWKNYTLFGNVENFTNVRQTNYQSLRSAPYDTPQLTEVWAPLDGIVFNAGIKVRL